MLNENKCMMRVINVHVCMYVCMYVIPNGKLEDAQRVHISAK